MTNLKTAIHNYISSRDNLKQIFEERFYRDFAPDDAKTPFLTYQRITGSENDVGAVLERYQFDLVGEMEDDDILEQARENLTQALQFFKGDLGGKPIHSAWLEVVSDDTNVETKTRKIILDFSFIYQK